MEERRMKVVIVAKTRMGSGACIGGLTFDGRSVRLVAEDAESNERFNMEYEVGDVWEVQWRPDEAIIPPHVENVIVTGKRRLPPIEDVAAFAEEQMPPRDGGVDVLYEGLTQATRAGALYVAEASGVPSFSTMFWRPDRPLRRETSSKRVRYRYPTEDGGRTLTFVGFQEPVEEIPAGTLLRVSLAHWWRPERNEDGEFRCFVQLSGWFLPGSQWAQPEQAAGRSGRVPLAGAVRTPARASKSVDLSMASAQRILKQAFGFDEFWPLQEEVIANVLEKQDTLAVMPTGSGKSLCYQLPALLFPGLTVVVSPLISLMQDQVDQLQAAGIAAVTLNSTVEYPEYVRTLERIRNGEVQLVYMAPETLLRPETMVRLERWRVDCLTIDEAHCISEWGHDFRPEYRQLVDVRRRLPDAVCLAVTATATERVREDIKQSLEITDADEFLASFDRKNLFLAVQTKTNGLAQTLAFLEEHGEQSGIIYCATRRQVEELAEQLAAHGWRALPYHAGLEDHVRHRHQRQFVHDEVPIMVATIAFGMGIDKSNVRFVVHYDLPKNLESYYQQIGRAGRDGLRADCLLLYSYGDVGTIEYFIRQQEREQQREARVRLEALIGFAETGLCRRRSLLAYFGETYEPESCEMCDNCLVEEQDLEDLTVPAQKFLSCVKRTGEIYGANHIINVLRGSRAKRVLQRGHDKLSTYNIGWEFSDGAWKYLANQFVEMGLLKRDAKYGSLQLTGKAYSVFRGERVYGVPPDAGEPAGAQGVREEDYDATLFGLLRDRRTELAEEQGVPPYVVFSDRSLVEMATYFPQSKGAFARIHGVGSHKLEKYAEAFLPVIRVYCENNEIEEVRKPRRRVRSSSGRGTRRKQVVKAYNGGQSIPEIAQALGVKRRTVVNHLWRAAEGGRALRANGFLKLSQLEADERERVLETFAEEGTEYLRPVFDALEGTVDYDELALLRLYFVSRERGDGEGGR